MLTTPAPSADAALRRALLPLLQPLAELARHAGAALSWSQPGGPERWLAAGPGCPCAGDPAGPGACPAYRVAVTVEVPGDGGPAGHVVVCAPGNAEGLLSALRGAVETAVRCAELERGEEALLHELSAAWESLEAVTEVSAAVRAREDTDALLGRIMGRAVGMR